LTPNTPQKLLVVGPDDTEMIVSAQEGERSLGARVVSAQKPVQFFISEPGPVKLRWKAGDNPPQEKQVIVEQGVKRVVIPAVSK
jgi:hypothetical protein